MVNRVKSAGGTNVKNTFTVEDTTSGRNQTRTEESLFKEAKQNCLGKIIDINFKERDGAKQTVTMSPSTTRPPKPVAPRSPIFEGGISWEEIVTEVEGNFMLPQSAAQQSNQKPDLGDL